MMFVDYGLSLFILIYTVALILLGTGLWFYRSPRCANQSIFASVLVAARNEEENIEACVRSLFKQNYDHEFYEVVVIDDRSSDRTADMVRSLQKEFHNLRLITIDSPSEVMAPKKNALNEGIKAAKGGIIVCTDADCTAEENWLASMVACFEPGIGMVVGYSPIEPKNQFSLIENFVALDSLTLASLAAGGTFFGSTLTATGRSLAYRKEVFLEVGGFSRIARFISGDDDLLLGLVKKTQWKIAYCLDQQAQVPTQPPGTVHQFINQKVRQASKSFRYEFKMITGLFLFYIFNVLLITYIPYKIWDTPDNMQKMYYVSFWGIKLLADLFLLTSGAWRFDKFTYLRFFPIMAVLYPFYIVIFGAWGIFGKFEWKDSLSQ